jgi:hypothetical protein
LKAGVGRKRWDQNLLGKCLVAARTRIRQEESEEEAKLAAVEEAAAETKD